MLSFFKKDIFEELNKSIMFEHFIVLLFIMLGMLGWRFSYNIFITITLSITILLTVIFNSFKYIIPTALCIVFSYNGGFSFDRFPVEIVIAGVGLLFIIILYVVYNFRNIKTKKPKSFFGIFLLGISAIIPIFWNKVITNDTKLLYLIYFSWILYLLLFLILALCFDKDCLRMVIIAFSNITLLLFFETLSTVLQMHIANPDENIFSFVYSLGWGICNEVGIMLCFFLPFVFYELITTKSTTYFLVSLLKIILAMLGILLSSSRGAFIFGLLEFILLIVLAIIYSKNKMFKIAIMLLSFLIIIVVIDLKLGIVNIGKDVYNVLFFDKLDDNGRFKLYSRAFNLWKNNWLTRMLGSGIVSELEYRYSYGVWNQVYTVYHSTFFETLAFGGIFGIIGLCFHFYEKYKQLLKLDKVMMLVFLMGYIIVDLYGMIDNTYTMYYYMIPLIILMTAIDNKNLEFSTNYKCLNIV